MSRLCSADVLTRSQCPKSHQACFVTGISCPIRSVFLQYKSVTKNKLEWAFLPSEGSFEFETASTSLKLSVSGVAKCWSHPWEMVTVWKRSLALWHCDSLAWTEHWFRTITRMLRAYLRMASHWPLADMGMCWCLCGEPAFILVENISFTSYNGEKEFEKVEERSKQLDQIIKYHQIMFQGDQYHMTTCFLLVPVHPEKNHAKKHSFFQPNTFQLILPKDQRSIIIILVTIPPSLPPSPLPTLRCNKGLGSCGFRKPFQSSGGNVAIDLRMTNSDSPGWQITFSGISGIPNSTFIYHCNS